MSIEAVEAVYGQRITELEQEIKRLEPIWVDVPDEPKDEIYSPTRLEYFSATILSSLLIGRSLKDQKKCIAQSLRFAKDMLEALDG